VTPMIGLGEIVLLGTCLAVAAGVVVLVVVLVARPSKPGPGGPPPDAPR
jgi:hypothetical protein